MNVLERLLAAAEGRLEKWQAKLRSVEAEIEALRAAIAANSKQQDLLDPKPTAPREKGK